MMCLSFKSRTCNMVSECILEHTHTVQGHYSVRRDFTIHITVPFLKGLTLASQSSRLHLSSVQVLTWLIKGQGRIDFDASLQLQNKSPCNEPCALAAGNKSIPQEPCRVGGRYLMRHHPILHRNHVEKGGGATYMQHQPSLGIMWRRKEVFNTALPLSPPLRAQRGISCHMKCSPIETQWDHMSRMHT